MERAGRGWPAIGKPCCRSPKFRDKTPDADFAGKHLSQKSRAKIEVSRHIFATQRRPHGGIFTDARPRPYCSTQRATHSQIDGVDGQFFTACYERGRAECRIPSRIWLDGHADGKFLQTCADHDPHVLRKTFGRWRESVKNMGASRNQYSAGVSPNLLDGSVGITQHETETVEFCSRTIICIT